MLHLLFWGGHPQFSVISIVFISFLLSSDHHAALGISSFHHHNQPKQRTSVRKIPEEYHRLTSFDPSKMGMFFITPQFLPGSLGEWVNLEFPPPVTMFRSLSSFLRPELLLLLRFRRSLNCSNCSNYGCSTSMDRYLSVFVENQKKILDVWGFGLTHNP